MSEKLFPQPRNSPSSMKLVTYVFDIPQDPKYSSTRNVEAFLEKTAIAYRQNVVFFLEFGMQ